MSAMTCETPGCRNEYEVIVANTPDGFRCKPCADKLEEKT